MLKYIKRFCFPNSSFTKEPSQSTPSLSISNMRILIVDDDKADRYFIKRELKRIDNTIKFFEADSAEMALDILNEDTFDCITLDQNLPDTNGLEAILEIEEVIPIIMISGNGDDALGMQALKYGAQDFLCKDQLTGDQIYRSICFAVERNRLLTAKRDLSFRDELTKLYNRRGFLYYAEKRLNISHKPNCITRVIFIDIDNLKSTNDTLGHEAGDQLIKDTADILTDTFRQTDIICRLGGDEFAVLLTRHSATFRKMNIQERLRSNIRRRNTETSNTKLSLTLGFTDYKYTAKSSIEELLSRADKEMYKKKKIKKKRNYLASIIDANSTTEQNQSPNT